MFALPLGHYAVATLVLYIPFHFFEDALGNFPETMYRHGWIPERITYGHWMANNVFFYYPTLLAGLSLYALFPDLVFLGLGILIWGILNTLDHLFYTLKDRKLSPGLFTGFIYLAVSICGLISVKDRLSAMLVALSLVAGVFYGFFPILCCMKFNKRFRAIFR